MKLKLKLQNSNLTLTLTLALAIVLTLARTRATTPTTNQVNGPGTVTEKWEKYATLEELAKLTTSLEVIFAHLRSSSLSHGQTCAKHRPVMQHAPLSVAHTPLDSHCQCQ